MNNFYKSLIEEALLIGVAGSVYQWGLGLTSELRKPDPIWLLWPDLNFLFRQEK